MSVAVNFETLNYDAKYVSGNVISYVIAPCITPEENDKRLQQLEDVINDILRHKNINEVHLVRKSKK